jgi:CRP-like cAMP-binding protein
MAVGPEQSLTRVKNMKFQEIVEKHGRHLVKDAGQYLFQQGEKSDAFYVVKKGLMKAYYVDNDGRESIKSFLMEGDIIGSLKSVFGDGESSFNLVCLEASELVVVDFYVLYDASRNDVELASEFVDFLLSYGMKKETREFELLCLTAEDRYRRLVSSHPTLFARVTQNDVARYLGITPVGLSRIKRRVSKQGER